MDKELKFTAEECAEYKKLKKFNREISDNYEVLYQQVLHMQLLVSAYFDNETNHHSYRSDDIFDLIFHACEEMHSSAWKMYNMVYENNRNGEQQEMQAI